MQKLVSAMDVYSWRGRDGDAAIRELEVHWKRPLPPDYREFLLTTNGGRVLRSCILTAVPGDISTGYQVSLFCGVGVPNRIARLEVCPLQIDDYDEGDAVSLLPIGFTMASELICLCFENSSAVVCLMSFENIYRLAGSFEHFVNDIEALL